MTEATGAATEALVGPPPAIAGHNLALFAQLRAAGWPTGEIEAIGRGYRLALELVSGQYRANGKPFVDHFVGTASVVASVGGRPALVRAALAHNAYRHGLWPDGRPGVTPRRRRELRAVLGDEAEDLVRRYESFAWWEDDIEALLGGAEDLSPVERDLVLLRLANEVEDRSDWGELLSHQHRRPLGPQIELARRIGVPALARWLAHVEAQEATAVPEPALIASAHGVEVIPARAHRRRLRPALHDGYLRARRRAGRVRRRLSRRR